MKRLALALMLAAAGAVTGCTSDGKDSGSSERITQLPQADDTLSPELLLPLRQAQNLHHIADVQLQMGKVAEATDAVRQILSLHFPAAAPEAEDVTLDARARLARMLVPQGKLADALATLDQGIQQARGESFFLSNVYTARGEVLEAMAVQLDATDKAAADARREDAIRSRRKAIAIDAALMKQLEGK
jgi:tetratricopeptide (TPR) repeat protein